MASDKAIVDVTDEFAVEDAPTRPMSNVRERETDPRRIAQRQKQIDFGKNTVGYQRYREEIPVDSRTKEHPRTPDVHQMCSKRAFDGQIRKWRRCLHDWDMGLASTEDTAAEANIASPERHHDSKNDEGMRQTGVLPLKIPSAMRPTTKRSRAQPVVATFTSPTGAPPDAKHARRTWAETVAKQHPTKDGAVALMDRWKNMIAEPQSNNDTGEISPFWEGAPEVSYSDDDVMVEPMVL